jgi:hypothetical protein
VKVVLHEAIRMHLPEGLATPLLQGLEKHFMVLVLQEDVLTAIASIQHVVNGAFIFHAGFPGHGQNPA